MKMLPSLISMSLIVAFSAACSSLGGHHAKAVDNAALPSTVQVPDGYRQKLWSRGVGEITYACREKPDQKGSHGWVFVAPVATLYGSDHAVLGKYYAGPTWEGADGSKVTGKQAGVSAMGAENIPLQLVKTNPAGSGGILEILPTSSDLRPKEVLRLPLLVTLPAQAWNRKLPMRQITYIT
jgi:hypothetical protein